MAKAKSVSKAKAPGLLENVKTVLYAGLIAIGIRTFAFEPFNIPSGSMIPTLLVGDYVFVSKFSYGYSRFSLPFSPPLFSGRVLGGLPHRGDVAVFRKPTDTSIDYIKRIVGLPGDRIQVTAGQLYVNGTLVARMPVGNVTDTDSGVSIMQKEFSELLPASSASGGPGTGTVQHDILKSSDEGFANNTPEFLVPPDKLFAMGDNRDNSEDSRFMSAVGFVPVENLVGRAEIIFFSVDATAPWWQVWQWPFEIRWGRLLSAIH